MKVLVSAIKDEAGCCRLSTIRNASAWPVLLEQRERGLGATLLSVPQPRQVRLCLHFTLNQDKLGIGSLLGVCAAYVTVEHSLGKEAHVRPLPTSSPSWSSLIRGNVKNNTISGTWTLTGATSGGAKVGNSCVRIALRED
jgi:hypothetical protein